MFPLFRSSLCFALMLRLCAHVLDTMSMVMLCSDLCVRMLFAMFYAQIHICTCLYAWIHVLPCLFASFNMFHMHCHAYAQIYIFTCLHARIQVFTCLYVWIYVLTCSCVQIFSLLALCHLPCAYVLHAMFVCLDLGYVCLAMCYCSPFIALPFFLAFWRIGSDLIQTLWSLSSSIHLGSYQRVWITLFCMSMLACSYALCFCQPLLFYALPRLTPSVGTWLCGYVRRPRGLVWM